jgi:HEAT repeat protein
MRRRAIFPLSNFNDASVVEALISQLKSGEELTRWMAVNALSRLRTQKAEALLSQIATSDPAPTVKAAASEALEKLKEARQPKPAPAQPNPSPARANPRPVLIIVAILIAAVVVVLVFRWGKESSRKRGSFPESGPR